MGPWGADLIMILVSVIWALNNVFMKIAIDGWVTPSAFNAIRFSLGAVLLAGFTFWKEGSLRIPWNMLPKVMLLGLVGNGLNQMLFINGLARTTASNAGVWLGIVPVLVALISGAFRLEKITARLLVGTAISTVGILTVLTASAHGVSFGLGDLLLAGAVTAWAAYTVFARPLADKVPPLRVTAVAMLTASVGLLLYNMPDLMAQDFSAVPAKSWLGAVYAASLSNALGYSLYVWAVKQIGSARVALYNNLGPILTALGAWLLLGEVWNLQHWLGVCLVIGGVMFARWSGGSAGRPEATRGRALSRMIAALRGR